MNKMNLNIRWFKDIFHNSNKIKNPCKGAKPSVLNTEQISGLYSTRRTEDKNPRLFTGIELQTVTMVVNTVEDMVFI